MPQIFSIGSYVVYFWSDEGEPQEPVHVHVAQERPQKNGTKIWITKKKQALRAAFEPARRGSGQATKRSKSTLLAGAICVATCLGARGRPSPPS